MTLEEKIKKINKSPNTVPGQLKPLESVLPNTAVTISDFWKQVVEPMLPDYDTMKKWHNLLIDYVEKMRSLDFPCESENVFTSGMAAGMFLQENKKRTIFAPSKTNCPIV